MPLRSTTRARIAAALVRLGFGDLIELPTQYVVAASAKRRDTPSTPPDSAPVAPAEVA
jgi:hypothetical protein